MGEKQDIKIYEFMTKNLRLRGKTLLIYAIIYDFSQHNQPFNRGLRYLVENTNTTKAGVIKCLKNLEERGLIKKTVSAHRGVGGVEYSIPETVNTSKNYTAMSNFHLADNRLSLRAKGLLSLVLSYPKNWECSIENLCDFCIENEKEISQIFSELTKYGYLIVEKRETENGKVDYIYHIYERPQAKGGIENG